jgi:hypothetical protein
MHADRAPNVIVALGNRAHAIERAEARPDREHCSHTGGARAADNGVEFGPEVREVQMAVAVNEHQVRVYR